MGWTERIVLWAIVGLTFVGLITLTVVVFSELNEINQSLLALTGGVPQATSEGGELRLGGSAPNPPAQVGVAGVSVLTDTIAMTVTVRASGAGDLLFEPPVLQTQEGRVYLITAESLEEARMAFLDLVTRGEATACLEFSGRPSQTTGLWLVFNPNQEPSDLTAPSLRVAVPFSEAR